MKEKETVTLVIVKFEEQIGLTSGGFWTWWNASKTHLLQPWQAGPVQFCEPVLILCLGKRLRIRVWIFVQLLCNFWWIAHCVTYNELHLINLKKITWSRLHVVIWWKRKLWYVYFQQLSHDKPFVTILLIYRHTLQGDRGVMRLDHRQSPKTTQIKAMCLGVVVSSTPRTWVRTIQFNWHPPVVYWGFITINLKHANM